jgi:hypothetical protein
MKKEKIYHRACFAKCSQAKEQLISCLFHLNTQSVNEETQSANEEMQVVYVGTQSASQKLSMP